MVVALSALTNAQATVDLISTQYSVSDGLAHNSVRSIYQDAKGFVWLGTLHGLSRFDGSQFQNYGYEEGVPSLPDGGVRNIHEDKRGFLWISSDLERMSCYDLHAGRFVDFTGCGEYDMRCSSIFFASNGDVWLWSSLGGARRVRLTKEGFESKTFTVKDGNLAGDDVYRLAEDEQGRIWIITRHGVHLVEGDAAREVAKIRQAYAMVSHLGTYFISRDGRQMLCEENGTLRDMRLSLTEEPTSITGMMNIDEDFYIFTRDGSFVFNALTERISPCEAPLYMKNGMVQTDNHGNFWIYNYTGEVCYVNASSRKVKTLRLMPQEKMQYIDNERYHFVHDSRDMVWISTYGNGVFAYDLRTETLQHFAATVNGFSHIPSDYLLSIMEDHAGGLWVGSEFSGVSHLTVINEGATYYYPAGESPVDNRANMVRLVTSLEDGKIYVGTRHGAVYIYDEDLRLLETKHFHSNIYTAAYDAEGDLWLGSRGEGLSIDGRWYKHSDLDSTTIASDNIFVLHCDRKDRMWVGSFHGGLDLAYRTDDGQYAFRHFFDESYTQKQIRAIAEDANGYLWVGTSEGIVVFDPDSLVSDETRFYQYGMRNSDLESNEIKSIYVDRSGYVWLATAGAGLTMCSAEKGYDKLEFTTYDTSDGLVNNMVQAVVEDGRGRIWASTEYGMSCLDRRTGVFENHFFSSYIMGNTYSDNSVCTTRDGKLMFGSIYGLVVVDPNRVGFRDAAYVPQVCLTALKVNGIMQTVGAENNLLTADIAYTSQISLEHDQNNIEIDFSTFDFVQKGSVKYICRLDPYVSEWSQPSDANNVVYKKLPPGDYTFRVKACNVMGVWAERETQLAISIAPPFWQSTWGYLIYAVIFIVVIFFLIRTFRKINALHNSIEVERQLTDYKLVFFTNISHEFRTPLTLIQGALEKIEDGSLPKDKAYAFNVIHKSTHRLLRLVNQLLEFRKMQNNKLALSLEETDVVGFVNEIFLTFKDAAESKKMQFRFEPAQPMLNMYIDKSNVDKVVYNLLSNAFKYTPSGGTIRLVLSTDETARQLVISVSDTGVGVAPQKRGELFSRYMHTNVTADSIGIGLHLTSELVKVHHGTIEYSENPGGGSIFTVRLPLDKDVYAPNDFVQRSGMVLESDASIEHRLKEEEELNAEAEGQTDADTDAEPLNRQKILIIEDDDDVREFLKKEVGFYFDVAAEADGKAGLDYAQQNDVDLIVCDVMMPRMSGFEVTKILKKNMETCHIPIILLTALGSEDQQIEGFNCGADAYITKPFSPHMLMTRITKMIEQRMKLRDKFTNSISAETAVLSKTVQDKEFAEKLQHVTESQLDNPQLSVDDLASRMNMGRTIFYRKVKGVIGYSPNEYIRIMRLKKGAELLMTTSDSIAEISYKIGFNDPFYFSKCFKQQFGVTPSGYQKGERQS